MDLDVRRPSQVLENALRRLLRPLVRLLLRRSIPFALFEDIARQVYVDVASEEFSIPGRKPTVSRTSVLTGMTRKEVQRRMDPSARSRSDGDGDGDRYNRAARVLSAWVRNGSGGASPRSGAQPIPFDGERGFAALARRYSGDIPPRAVLDELLRVGAVVRREDGLLQPVERAYVPHTGIVDKLRILGTDVAALIETIDHNIEHGDEQPRYQRKVSYESIPVEAVEEFRRLSAIRSQQLLEDFDRWLSAADERSDAASEEPGFRVGVGIYYFEEPNA